MKPKSKEYQKLKKELKSQKSILKMLKKSNKEAIKSTQLEINNIKKQMGI